MPAPNSEARILSRKTPRTRLASDAVAMMIAPEVILFALLWKILRIMFFCPFFKKTAAMNPCMLVLYEKNYTIQCSMLQTSSCSQKGHLRFKTCFHDLFFKHDVTLFKDTLFDLTNKLANIL